MIKNDIKYEDLGRVDKLLYIAYVVGMYGFICFEICIVVLICKMILK